MHLEAGGESNWKSDDLGEEKPEKWLIKISLEKES